jgi:hypothetical protein
MATLKTTFIQHPDSLVPQISLSASGMVFSASALELTGGALDLPEGTTISEEALLTQSSASSVYAPINSPTFTGALISASGFGGTGSSAGILGGIAMPFVAERNGVGTAGNTMAFGNGAGTIKGARMPFAGKLVAATLHGTAITGTITLDAYVNASTNTSYRLTGTGSASDINVTQNWQSSPLPFAAGSTINFIQTVVPTTSSGYLVTFFVVFD